LLKYLRSIKQSRSQWRGSAAARLLIFWFRIPAGHGCLSVVSVVCCQVEVYATSWSFVQRSPTECGVSLCDVGTSKRWGDHGPPWAQAPQKKKNWSYCIAKWNVLEECATPKLSLLFFRTVRDVCVIARLRAIKKMIQGEVATYDTASPSYSFPL